MSLYLFNDIEKPPKTAPNLLIYKYLTNNSFKLKDLAGIPAKSLSLKDRQGGEGGPISLGEIKGSSKVQKAEKPKARETT